MPEEVVLDRLLSDENLQSLAKLSKILSVLNNKYGLLDLLEGIANDEETVGSLVATFTSDKYLSLLENWKGLLDSALELLNEDTISTIKELLNVYSKVKRTGIIDAAVGMLTDEETLTKVMGYLTNDKVLALSERVDNVIDLVEYLTREENLLAIRDAIDLVSALRSSGLLDPIRGALKDEDIIKMIGLFFSSDFFMNFMQRFEEIIKDLSRFDLTNFKYYTLLVNETGEALKEEDIKPIKSIFELYKYFKNPEVQIGLGVVMAVLRHIGKYHMKYINPSSPDFVGNKA